MMDVLFQKTAQNINAALAADITWLEELHGISERLVKMAGNKKIFTPNIYRDGNEYRILIPDSHRGNFSFWRLEDPIQLTDFNPKYVDMKAPASLIVWCDLRKVWGDRNTRDINGVVSDVIKTLTSNIKASSRFRPDKVYTLAETVYKGYTLDEIDNQFMMHPYAAFRVEGVLRAELDFCQP